MSSLAYRPDADEARDRLTRWWNGGDLGRPAMLLKVKREKPWAEVPALPTPEGWVTHYSTKSLEYRVNAGVRESLWHDHLCEAMPVTAADLGPNCLALYLGCRGVEAPGTVWFEPCIEDPAKAVFRYDPGNFYWDFTVRLATELVRAGQGKFLVQFPDIIEGLDTLAAMRGSETLLEDLIDRPKWVHDCLGKITDLYFTYYDPLYALLKDERGGTHFWVWAPGRCAKLQCDFSAMISPRMFGEFMVPVLREMTGRLDFVLYHWDGPGAIAHQDHLLSVPGIRMLQWTPGAAAEPAWHERWWPIFHKTLDAGRMIMISDWFPPDKLAAMKREFGRKLNRFLLGLEAASQRDADELIRIVSD
jgi:5-methyltetrahydrofolate--homocysteine methyltransferase